MTDNISWLNFNDAPDMDDVFKSDYWNIDEVKGALHQQIHSALAYLYPNGKIQNKQFVVGNIKGDPGKSLTVELEGDKTGLWIDFATGDSGDILHLWARARGWNLETDLYDVMSETCRWLALPIEPKKQPEKMSRDLGHHTKKWDYVDAQGKLIACVYRYDTPTGKEFRPWDVKAKKNRAPNPRPLYNIPAVLDTDIVVLVEGEKCADALIEQNIVATTAMNGSNAPTNKTDWSPLKNKRVIIWPDNDDTGKTYAERAASAIAQAGALLVTIMDVPEGKPAKWDAADAVEDNENVSAYIEQALTSLVSSVDVKPHKRIVIQDWLACERFTGEPKKRQWLVEGIFPMGQVSLFAASGGVGKSYLLLELTRAVAKFNGFRPTAPTLFGGSLAVKGSAVYITAEDDETEVHSRLFKLGDIPNHLYTIPLPDCGGAQPLFAPDPIKRVPTVTDAWNDLVEQLKAVPDLRVIVFDPLQPLCSLDFNVPENAQFVCSRLAALANETGAAVIVSHHFAKREASTPEQAREAIRGSGGLVDGVRSTYALWQVAENKAEEICRDANVPFIRGGVAMGGVVKANGQANLKITTFIRDKSSGILVDRSYEITKDKKSENVLFKEFVNAISQAAKDGKPYTKSGLNGVYERRFELTKSFHSVGRQKLIRWVDELQADGKLVAASAPGQTSVKWLDVPDGPVAKGEAEFIPGHIKGATNKRNKG